RSLHDALPISELQQRRFAKAEQARQQHIGKLLDAHVVEIDGFVVQLAAIGDAAFQATDALLQVAEALVGAQLRVVLGQREQPPQARAQTGFGLAKAPTSPCWAALETALPAWSRGRRGPQSCWMC